MTITIAPPRRNERWNNYVPPRTFAAGKMSSSGPIHPDSAPTREQILHALESQSLIKHLKLKSADEVLRLVAEYYPANQIPVKTQFLVESLFQEGRI